MLLRKTFSDKPEVRAAYLAGFFDGEGHVCPIDHPDTIIPLLHVGLSQTNFVFLDLVKVLYGGGVSENANGCWNWQLYGAEKQLKFLSDIQPYVILTHEEVSIAIEICKVTPPKGFNTKLQPP